MTSYPHQQLYMAVVSGTPFVAAVFVGLRLYARKRQRIPLGWDDYLIIVATLLSIALIIPSVMIGYTWNMGIHVYDLGMEARLDPDNKSYAQLSLAFNLLVTPIEPLVKCSVLLLLLKVSKVITPIRRAIYAILAFVVVTCLIPWVAFIFVCPYTTGGAYSGTVFNNLSCLGRIPTGILYIFSLSVNIFTDVLIFPIPILIMQNLKNATFRSRFAVILSFALSLGATAIAAVRFRATYQRLLYLILPSDWTYDISTCLQHLEINCAILLACMPATRSLLLGWTSKQAIRQPDPPGQSTVLRQRIPGESLLFQSFVVPEDEFETESEVVIRKVEISTHDPESLPRVDEESIASAVVAGTSSSELRTDEEKAVTSGSSAEQT